YRRIVDQLARRIARQIIDVTNEADTDFHLLRVDLRIDDFWLFKTRKHSLDGYSGGFAIDNHILERLIDIGRDELPKCLAIAGVEGCNDRFIASECLCQKFIDRRDGLA